MEPYGRSRGQNTRVTANPHRNRSLVLNNKIASQAATVDTVKPKTEDLEPISTVNGWVTKRDRHMQLINSSIYDKDAQARNKAMEETRKQKNSRRDQRERSKIERHLDTLRPSTDRAAQSATIHEIFVNGIRFQVLDGGSKLARLHGEGYREQANSTLAISLLAGPSDVASTTPKQANIGGVTFLRSKNGNLYRSGIVKAQR